MVKTIWKFPIDITSKQKIEIPSDYKILAIQTQEGIGLCMWAMVDPESPKKKITILTVGTGHTISADYKLQYIGTCQVNNGALVFHCFELEEVAS